MKHLEQGLLPESQCSFRKERGTIDMVFAARQLQEKCQEQNVDLYSTYVDLTKAFDTVSREGLWRIMAKYGCPPKFITIVRLLHDGMMARVQDDGNSSEPFLVSNGVKQGCVLAPTLFSLMFSVMLTDAFADTDIGIGIRHRMDGSIFNLRNTKSENQGQDRHHQWLPICWWLCPELHLSRWHAAKCWQIHWGLHQLRPDDQH